MYYCSEIFLTNKSISEDTWQKLIDAIFLLTKNFKTWRIIIDCSKTKLHYYIETRFLLPPSLHQFPEFLFQTSEKPQFKSFHKKPFLATTNSNFFELKTYFLTHKNQKIKYFEITFQKICNQKIISIYAHSSSATHQLFPPNPALLLSFDSNSVRQQFPQFAPKYLDSYKVLKSLQDSPTNSILEVETFPYSQTQTFLNLSKIDFAKHSIILGASGCGKSQFISLLVQNVRFYTNTTPP